MLNYCRFVIIDFPRMLKCTSYKFITSDILKWKESFSYSFTAIKISIYMFNNQIYFNSFAKIARASLSAAIQEDFFTKNFKNSFDTNSKKKKKKTDRNIKEKYVKLYFSNHQNHASCTNNEKRNLIVDSYKGCSNKRNSIESKLLHGR